VDLLAAIADERLRVADLVESLSASELDTPSLCGEWTVKEVAGHLLVAVDGSFRTLLVMTLRSGFNLHRANSRLAQIAASRSAGELAAGLRARAYKPFKPPIVGYPGQLTDLQVHSQDMCRPLGLPAGLRHDRLHESLEFLVGGRAVGFAPRRRLAGLHFRATDLDWSWGSGPAVSGTAEVLLLAMTGRTAVLDELAGAGVSILGARLGG
jgi:uncharacterized protein (TIGR03083 family)